MEDRKATVIRGIERILKNEQPKKEERLTRKQIETLADFDKFNDVESGTSLSTRLGYLTTLHKLGKSNKKTFEQLNKQDLKEFLSVVKGIEKESSFELRKSHLKRFFRWLHWHIEGEDGKIRSFDTPKCVNWIEVKHVDNNWKYEDLPSEKEILKISTLVETQRDRALILTVWETGAEPIAVLNLKVGDVTFNQYGGVVNFKPSSGKLKTKYRYRSVPISTAVPDLQLWLSMHPDKENPNAPLWVSRRGGSIGYARLRMIFLRAVKRAGIDKHYTLYKLRHARLTQLSNVLNVEELKKFAGHSRYSNVTPRYIHVNEEAMKRKVYGERGVKVKEAEKAEPTLKVKSCPRCKHENNPTSKFCSMCSMPLDTKTMFDVQ
ncbi:tyrosine-type recombinase/integrase, partial [Candidatus Bathyarchaeota archaeon]|nr:tyrosine-type recombinase/integrase [Candidatus Bathyarchaeota archaeon]